MNLMAAGAPDSADLTSAAARIAGAPISWGVSEVPAWGYQLSARRVLAEMSALGLSATEFGPPGFLPDDPQARAAQLAEYRLRAVGGFFLEVLHNPAHDPLPATDEFIDACIASGAGVVVLAAHSGAEGYDERPELDDLGWKTLLSNLDRLGDHARTRGVELALHPHVGTMVESADEIRRVLEGSAVGLCVDTGHMAVGGADPVAVTRSDPQRVRHVHLKDVDATMAGRVLAGDLAFGDAVRAGIFRPLGDGDVDIAALIRTLESAGYQGWYVLEQDVMLDGEPADVGPAANVRRSLEFVLQTVS
jgi:inosose dehydratase